ILFHQGSTGVFNNTVIRYGGSYYYSYYAETVGSISNHGGNISVTDSLVENNVLYGVKTYAGTTNISGTVLRDYWGFYGGGGQNKIEDLITLTNNVFDGGIYINLNGVRNFLHSGNTSTKSDGIYISGKLSQNQTWTKDNMPYIINGSGTTNYNSSDYVFSVPLGVTLNIDPGVIVKFKRNMSVSVKGNLIINGTNEQKVYFTSINDDTVGGDTNNDQSDIAPSAGDWNHLFFGDKSVSQLSHVAMKYGGRWYYSYSGSNNGVIYNSGGNVSLVNSSIEDNEMYGIRQYYGSLNISSSQIKNNQSYGIYVERGSLNITNSDIFGHQTGVYSKVLVNAKDNYWGDSSGPYHLTKNPNGKGDKVSDNVNFTPWLTKEICKINCFSNVMFFPGIMGSRLYLQESNGEKELWVSADDALQSKLTLNTNGKNSNVYTKNDTQKISDGYERETGIVDEISGFNIYNSFLFDLKDWKKEGTINDYHFIPYDWRVALEDIVVKGDLNVNGKLFYNNNQTFSESFILKKLKELQATSRTGRVTLIGHSNGGLVIKALIQKLKETNDPLYDKIDQVIFVGVPQIGTPQALINMLHGESMGPVGFVMTAKRNRWLAKNMPTAYNLLPSVSYFSINDPVIAPDQIVTFQNHALFNPQISKYGLQVNNFSELKDYVLGGDGRAEPLFDEVKKPAKGNSILFPKAESVHNVLDSWQPSSSTKVVQLAGWGKETVSGIEYKTFVKSGQEDVTYKPKYISEGDNTVVTSSALWMSDSNLNVEKWWVDLIKYDTWFAVERNHKDIMEVSNLRDFIKSKITGVPFSDSEDVVVKHYPTTVFAPRIHYHLFTEGRVGIVDAKGRYTGVDFTTGKVKQEIPQTRYTEIGSTKFISVPDGLAYTLKIDPTEDVVMDVDRQVGNDVTDSNTVMSKFSKSKLFTVDANASLDVKGLKFKEVLKNAVNTNQ
ncbi:MAG: right-handed parallel beta-helix repeat-containing protein, partial [Patescibacteria group bacterium]